jgi:two-component system CheB/CheR fusion protein
MSARNSKRSSGGNKRGGVRRTPSGPARKTLPVPTAKPRAMAHEPKPTDGEPRAAERDLAAASPLPVETRGEGSVFPIVGIGASAGGLEALEQFLRHTPGKSGVAFVVIQHLDPTHKGMLVELLQRSTEMPVLQAKDHLTVERDHVYVIPPNKDMSLLHGRLHLMPQAAPRGLNLPIDFFFRSLAEDQHERSIGVILSGMGSDGTLGLRAIKEKAGAAFVQALPSAKFESMPRSVIEAGLADVVAPVEELPEKILAYSQRAPHINRAALPFEDKAQGSLEKVFILLRTQTGNDFSLYKRSTIYRRIERRMGLHQIDTVAHYVRYLRENPRETELLFKELLIGVTSFFREPIAWEHLRKDVLPALVSSRPAGGVLRAWVPGCSTGEEAYSLAIVFKEAMEPFAPIKNAALQIFATDLDREAIEKARHGIYPANIAADVSPERLRRFFVQEERGYRVGKEIRDMVVFAPQNIIMDPPFTKLDILSCRNLLIYLSSELQKKLIPLFHYSLNPGGVLFLGTAETVGTFTHLFSPLDGKTRIYRRLDQAVVAMPVDFPASVLPMTVPAQGGDTEAEGGAQVKGPPANLQTLADRVLVQRFSPVGILCNEKGDVLYISGRTGRYLEPPIGRANLNVVAMAREGLRYDLSRAFATAARDNKPVEVRGLTVRNDSGNQTVNLTIQKLAEPKELRGTLMVIIADAPPPPEEKKPRSHRKAEPSRLAELEQEVQRARDEVQTAREEMQTSQEELKSTNEELQSTNEELQSSNEELTTSKEEMQSLNEELQTVNHELQAKVDELSRANNDMKNLLNSTDIATLFLDSQLNVRRFTTPTSRIIKLIAGDAGRPITDITSDLNYPELADDAREVLRTLVFKEKLVGTHEGHWYAVRIMPYRTLENVIDGVVLTFTDATVSKDLETALHEQASQLRQLAGSLPVLLWAARPNGSCDFISRQWLDYTRMSEGELLGYGWLHAVHAEEREPVREAWRAAVKTGSLLDVELRIRRGDDAYRWFKTQAIPIRDSQGQIVRWYGASTDVDDLKRAQASVIEERDRVADLLENLQAGVIALNHDLAVTALNPAAERILDRTRHQVVGRGLFDALPAARGSTLDHKLNEALRERAPLTFDARLDGAPQAIPYTVRVFPQRRADGLTLLLEPGPGERTAR